MARAHSRVYEDKQLPSEQTPRIDPNLERLVRDLGSNDSRTAPQPHLNVPLTYDTEKTPLTQ